jgi:hypothetical protein
MTDGNKPFHIIDPGMIEKERRQQGSAALDFHRARTHRFECAGASSAYISINIGGRSKPYTSVSLSFLSCFIHGLSFSPLFTPPSSKFQFSHPPSVVIPSPSLLFSPSPSPSSIMVASRSELPVYNCIYITNSV